MDKNIFEGMKEKFYVVKKDDVRKYLNYNGQTAFYSCLETIADGRSIDGKKYNKYLVINIDEPYAPEIVEILKKNGHWG